MENFEQIRLPWQDWKIVKYLGGGGFGSVYEIERTASGIQEKAALKIISRPKDDSELEDYCDSGYDQASLKASYESELRSYVQEYRMMKELQGQSNIVSCDDFAVVPNPNGIGGKIFIRMELLTSLLQVLRERALSEQEIVKLGKDVARALILCHSRQIVHRDIKPANIMISEFGDYKLGDFGISKKMDHKTLATAVGTQEYWAPEVIHMEKYDSRADIYSLGITLYWLLNNRKMPFIGADELMTPMMKDRAMERRYQGELLPAPKHGSAKLRQIVLKACAYRPEDRFASAQALYEALDALGRDVGSAQSEKPARSSGMGSAAGTMDGQTGQSRGATQGATQSRTQGTTYGGTNDWRSSGGSIGDPAKRAQQQKAAARAAGTDTLGRDFVAGVAAAPKAQGDAVGRAINRLKEEHRSQPVDPAEQALAKIGVYDKPVHLLSGGLGCVFFAAVILFGIPIVMYTGLIGILGLVGVFVVLCLIDSASTRGDDEKFGAWMKESKMRAGNMDELIKHNPEFAKRLYKEKCQDERLLKYMEALNAAVVHEIKAKKK